MAFDDLRGYLEALERDGELVRVRREVASEVEMGAILRKLSDEAGPAVLFEQVTGPGAAMPVAANLFGTRRRAALAAGTTVDRLMQVWLDALAAPVAPVMVASGPCQEVVREVDLTRDLPNILWNQRDGGPYITFALCVCRDPLTGIRNVGIYRVQIKGPNRVGINLNPPQHGGICQKNAEERGQPLEIALVLGCDPALYLASQAVGDFNLDEVALAGGLRGGPVELVRCQSVDLEVPATAEIVLEGEVLPNVREEEGPFGEFHGYYSGIARRQVAELKVITHRRDPIYLGSYEGKPPTETHVIHSMGREPVFFSKVREYVCPTVKDLHVTYAGFASAHVFVSIRQQAAGQAKNVALDLLKFHNIKHVVVVDEDIDVRNPTEVEWAISTRVQANRDVIVLSDLASIALDPSQPEHPTGRGAKMAIDATMPFGRPYDLIELPADVVETVRGKWEWYGLGRDGR